MLVTVAGVPLKLTDLPPEVRAAVEAELGTAPAPAGTPLPAPTPATRPPGVGPLTREQFRSLARPLAATVAGKQFVLHPREFKTGNAGWWAGGRVELNVGGTMVAAQVGITVTILKPKR